ncbi:MAG: MCE family protein [Aeromicrobium sp.]|uniref:MCE family protein n=1 Tax=Aeromicrobium sp. TaxID=1871063 RepID=UPI0039E3A6E2
MPRTPTLDRPSVLKTLGIGFLCLMLLFVWLTWAFFNKSFVSTEDVTLKTSKAGSQLPKNADVKLRGMIVGEVTDMEVTDDGVELTLGMNPDLIDKVPAGVTAQILPKTLFGEKYIALIPPESASGRSLKAGDTIEKANVPIELESVLNNLYGLLEAVEPEELATTLTAVATALDGRGEQLGTTLVDLNAYLNQINPDIPQAVDDLVKLGQVSDVYAAALPDLARVLENSVTTGKTVVEKDAQLSAFLTSTATLADTLTAFFAASGQDLIDVNAYGRRSIYQAGRYSETFPCFFNGLDAAMPRLNSIFRENTTHISLEIIPPSADSTSEGSMPDPYELTELTDVSYDELNDPALAEAVAPTCYALDQADFETRWSQDATFKGPALAGELYKLVGMKSAHGKFFNYVDPDGSSSDWASEDQSDWSVDTSTWNRPGVSSEWTLLDTLVTKSVGLDPETSSDLAPLLLGSIYDGAEVAVQ